MLTVTEAGLLRAILDDPADDTPRLILADWFDETGQSERAEFIRRQIEHARHWPSHAETDGCSCASCRNFRRCGSLLRDHPEWAEPARSPAITFRAYRGFVETLTIRTEMLLQHADAIFAGQPVTRVLLADRQPARVANVPARWAWFHHDEYGVDRSALLPAVLMGEERRMTFRTPTAAWEWASRTCVAWGRLQAGLSPLPLASHATGPLR
jgi:uncharacterized protein (TIGR02996 family)